MGPEDARAAGVPARLYASVQGDAGRGRRRRRRRARGRARNAGNEARGERKCGWIGGALPGAGARAPTVAREAEGRRSPTCA